MVALGAAATTAFVALLLGGCEHRFVATIRKFSKIVVKCCDMLRCSLMRLRNDEEDEDFELLFGGVFLQN